MELIDLKLPKEKRKTGMIEPMREEGPKYPYGMKLNFESEEVDKIPDLKEMSVGEAVKIEGIGEVVSIRMNEDKDKEKRFTVEIQLHKVGCIGNTSDEKIRDSVRIMLSERQKALSLK